MDYNIIPPSAINGVTKVFNQGIIDGHDKYGWRDNNSVSELISKLKKKLLAFEKMNDIDDDGLYNIDKVAAYALMLHDLISTNPHHDDRFDHISNSPRVALDVDDVVADFIGGYQLKTGDVLNNYWNSNYDLPEKLKELANDEEFWVNLPLKNKPNFEPYCYISSRGIPIEFTKKFIQKNGLPCAPVYHVPWNQSKITLLKEHKIDIFIDDKVENFLEATKNGIFTYLMDAPHNQYFDAKNRRIFNLELFK